MLCLPTFVHGISSQTSLAAIRAGKPEPYSTSAKVLMVLTLGISAGIYSLYRYLYSELQVRLYAKFADQIALHTDLADGASLRVLTGDGYVTVSAVTLGGEPRVKLSQSDGSFAYLDAEIHTVKQLQDRIRKDITADRQTYEALIGETYYGKEDSTDMGSFDEIAFQTALAAAREDELPTILDDPDICQENIVFAGVFAQPPGGGHRESVVLKYANGDIFIFRLSNPSQLHFNEQYGMTASGISRSDQFGNRSVFTYAMSQDLGFDVVPETLFTTDNLGRSGHAVKLPTGLAFPAVLAASALRRDAHESLKSNPIITKKFVELQLLDALTGQIQRYRPHIFVDLDTDEVNGIHNEICAGSSIVHPNQMVTVFSSDAWALKVNKMTPYENNVLADFLSQGMRSPRRKLRHLSVLPAVGVLLPPIMDTDMVTTFKELTYERLLGRMIQMDLSEPEMRAACQRLDAINAHIQVLERRQELGNPSIIDPNQWACQVVRDKLFNTVKGNKLEVSTTYLQREINPWSRFPPKV